MNPEPLQRPGSSDDRYQGSYAIIFKPIFWNIREKLERLFGILELDTQMLQQCQLRVVGVNKRAPVGCTLVQK